VSLIARAAKSGGGLAAASALATLLLGEAVLTVAGYHYSPLKVLTPRRDPPSPTADPAQAPTVTDWRFEHAFGSADFTFDPELVWRPVPGRGVFNQQGFRGHEVHGPKAPGSVRVLAMGDSNTLGHQGAHGANWPLLLEVVDSRLAVINAGVYGYSSFQGALRLREFLGFRPDIVLVSFGANDGHPVATTDAQYARRLARRRGLLRLLAVSRVGQMAIEAHDKLQAWREQGAPPVRRVDLAEYGENLARMIRMCREQGAVPVLLTRPFIGRTRDPESWKSVGPDYNQVTRELAAREGVLLVDVFKQFKRRPHLFEDESHFTPAGHWEAARYVYESLRPLLGGPSA
jgi:lysophospholipase L1-like esterase